MQGVTQMLSFRGLKVIQPGSSGSKAEINRTELYLGDRVVKVWLQIGLKNQEWGFLGGSVVKNQSANAGDMDGFDP